MRGEVETEGAVVAICQSLHLREHLSEEEIGRDSLVGNDVVHYCQCFITHCLPAVLVGGILLEIGFRACHNQIVYAV